MSRYGFIEAEKGVTRSPSCAAKLVALRKNGVLYYAGSDHLGSTVRLTDSGGNPIASSRQRYGVWGAGVSRKPERLEADEFGPRYAWAR